LENQVHLSFEENERHFFKAACRSIQTPFATFVFQGLGMAAFLFPVLLSNKKSLAFS